MKLSILALLCFVFLSCKETTKEVDTQKSEPVMVENVDDSKFPEALRKIFKTHGGLDAWKKKEVLSFEIPKPNNRETHTIDLRTRDEIIEMPGVSMGSKGSDIWLLDGQGTYKGNAVFYHNLMFYFYAMPFVLSDEGIHYDQTEALEFEGKTYPGIRISYGDGVGLSSKDEYFLHYDPETFQMEWLGYTVTYRSGEKSDNIRWIRYNDWMNVEDVILPKSLTWHEYEGRTIKEARDPLNFENVSLSETAPMAEFFKLPEGAKIMNGKAD